MRYLNRFTFLLILFSLIVSMPGTSFSKGDKNSKRIRKTTGDPKVTWFTINNIATIFSNEAMSDLNGQDSGFEYPIGSNKTVFYESGFVYGGSYKGEWRMGGSTYFHSQVPGRIQDDGTPEDPGLSHVRIFRVRRDFKNSDANFSKEVYKHNLSVSEIVAQYQTDWDEWPWQYGAPYEDANGDGIYNPAIDIPGVPGADQTIWFVCNDLDPTKEQAFYGTLGLGMEMQATIWGYNSSGTLGNALFRRYTLINKGGENIDSMYVCMWSDPDLGDANDDYTGCDTTLSLGFIYNGDDNDAQYGANAPAAGFDFFQGPIVEGLPTDQAIFKGQVRPGYKNLNMSSYFFFINGDNVYTDPEDGEKIGSLQFRNLMEGKVSTTGNPFIDPTTGEATKFALYGDPITGRGWIDGIIHAPGDRRLGMTAGPFNFAAGDTQEVVVGQVAAGATSGIDRFGAVGLLKFYDLELQQTYDNFFKVPPAIKAPAVEATALDQKVTLVWGNKPEVFNVTEAYDTLGFKFEGYVVYQLPNTSPVLDNGKVVETFDVKNLVQSIESTVFDAESNSITKKFTKRGTDSRIARSIVIDKDLIRSGQPPLANGTTYYFAVTAYAYNPDPEAVPNVLETPPVVIAVTPQASNPGITMTEVNSILDFTHSQGGSDGKVIAEVVDPSKVTGDSYEVTFGKDTSGTTVWNLRNKTKGQQIAVNKLEGPETDLAVITDGVKVNVSGAANDFKNFTTVANAAGPINPPQGFSVNWSQFTAPVAGQQQSTNNSRWVIGSNQGEDYGYAYVLGRLTQYSGGVGNPEGDPGLVRLIPDDFEIRFTQTGSKALMWWTTGNIVDVPFEIWNIQDPANANDDYQLFPLVLDNDENEQFNLTQIDNVQSGSTNDPQTDAIYMVMPLDETPGNKGYTDLLAKIQANQAQAFNDYLWAYYFDETSWASKPGLMRLVIVGFNLGEATDPSAWIAPLPETGTIFRISTTKPNQPDQDVFTFTAPTVDYSAEKAKTDVEQINVFPNPYYGVNPRETNKYQRYVTFSHLPSKATLRVFNLAGQLITTIKKESESPFATWNLSNDANIPVASGLYIIHIDMPELGKTKILKVAVIQEQQFLDRF